MTAGLALQRFPRTLMAALTGHCAPWPSLSMSQADFLHYCEREEIEGLFFHQIAGRADWPEAILNQLAATTRLRAALELVRTQEVHDVLDEMTDAGIQPIVMKGAALAHTVYPSPASRPRNDTDLLVRAEDVDEARRVMDARGYRGTVQCSELFKQFEVQKVDRLGVLHVFDVHWKISANPVFEDVLTHDEIRDRAEAVPSLGRRALALGPVDALLLACVHPVMHHHNQERLLWIYDIHLLSSFLSTQDFSTFVDRARLKRMSAVCSRSLQLAHSVLDTTVPSFVFSSLEVSDGAEPSAESLRHNRRWHSELAAGVRSLSRWRDRAALMRQVLFPSARYMRGAYGVGDAFLGTLLLPALYLHRNVHGAWKIVLGRK